MENQKALFKLPDFVLVHPDLAEDPVCRQGQIGLLTYAVINRDDFYVGFEDEEVGVYNASALLILKDADAIFRYADTNRDFLTEYEQNALLSIGLLELYAENSGYQKEAFRIALQHPPLMDAVLLSIEAALQLNRGPETGR
ncbi:hypothetical protein [Mucilaginibacter sp. PAMB04168]|uniref:hypothetical protein n=1 Tax=Mucilaginibacter sp. PAMB04168 TaxID=3138567 RepID=UPI0031F67ADA